MTVNSLVKALKEELEKIFEGFVFKTEGGLEEKSPEIFLHNLPIPESDEDPQPYPFIIIQTPEGKSADGDTPETARVILVIGIYDDNPDNQGSQDVLIVIERIRERFGKEPLLSGKYRKRSFEWMMDTDSYHPYYFGACDMTFDIPFYETEDEYS